MKTQDYFKVLMENHPLANWRVIRRYYGDIYNIRDIDLELIMELYKLKYFVKKDFESGRISMPRDDTRWKRLFREDGSRWIKIYRRRKQPHQNYHIYKLTHKAQLCANNCYKAIADINHIPLKYRKSNPHITPAQRKNRAKTEKKIKQLQAETRNKL